MSQPPLFSGPNITKCFVRNCFIAIGLLLALFFLVSALGASQHDDHAALLALLGFICLILTISVQSVAHAHGKRKESLKNLVETNIMLRSAEKISHLGSWKWRLADNSVFWSEELFKILNIPTSTASSIDLFRASIHPDDRHEVKAAQEDALAGSSSFEVQCRIVRPDGEIRHVICQGEVQRNEAGEPVSMTGTVMDSTEKKRSEYTLRQSEEQYRLLAENASDVVFRGDNSGSLVWISSSVTALVGWLPQELVGRPFAQLAHEDDRPAIIAGQQALARGKSVVFEARIRTRFDAYHWVSVSARPVLDAMGVVVARMGGWRDIQAEVEVRDDLRRSRDNAESALALRMRSETRFRTIFNQAPLGIALIDSRSGQIHEVNTRFKEISGRSREEIIAVKWIELIQPDDPTAYAEQMLLLNDNSIFGFQIDTQYAKPDGSLVWISMTIAAMEVESGKSTRHLCMIEDISQRKQYERYVEQAREAAESSNRSKTEFLSNMSHEIRTPMNAVLGLAQLLEKEPLLPDQKYMVQRIRTAGHSLLGILNDVLDFSKIEAGQLRIVMRPFTLPPLLEQLDSLLGSTARGKGLTLRILAPPEVMGAFLGDELRLEQILTNLVSNAIKFTLRGEILLTVQAVERNETAARLRFQVTDGGVGIAPEVLPTLFRPFTQADDSITRRFGGTGLGLSICKRLAELMGGTIGVESRVEVGSTFWFEIPFQRSMEIAATSGHSLQGFSADGPRLTALRILVVDDSELNRIVISRLLALEGAIIMTATNGQEALDTLRASPRGFDLVLMDVQMPVMDGLTATRAVRLELCLTHLPIIACTAGVLPEERLRALDAGVDDFLPKPVELEEMVSLILRWGAPQVGAASTPPEFATKGEVPPEYLEEPVSFFPEQFPGLDVAKGIATLHGGLKFYREMVGELVRLHGEDDARIREALDGGRTQEGVRIAHTLKGVAGNLAAGAVCRIASELEVALKDEQRNTIDQLLLSLKESLLELRSASLLLQEAPTPEQPGTEPLPDPGEVAPLLAELISLLEKRQTKALKVMLKLEKSLSGVHVGPEVALLSLAVERLEFAVAVTLADQLAQRLASGYSKRLDNEERGVLHD